MEEREPVIIKNEGQKIFGVFHRPGKLERFPTVLICHGLGGNKAGCCRLYVHIAKALTNCGIGALRFDFRGAGDSEGEFSEMTVKGMISDALASLEYLGQRPDVDADRLGIMGCSFGGTIAIMAANRFKRVRSLSTWAPLLDITPWLPKWVALNSPGITPEQKKQLMLIEGQLAGYPFLQELFSLQIGEELEALHHLPMLHIHGVKDAIIDISHADLFEETRKQSKAASRLIKLPNTAHDFLHETEQQQAVEETRDWFSKTL